MAANRTYKRSWRNYLLDPSYQLRFTLTMLAVAAGLMAPLGWWVLQKADRATEVATNQIDGIRCPDLLSVAGSEKLPVPPSVDGRSTDGSSGETEDLLAEDREDGGSGEKSSEREQEPRSKSGADVSDGDVSDGDVSDGDVTDGDVSDGDVSDGDVSDGAGVDGAKAATTGGEPESRRERRVISVDIDDSEMPTLLPTLLPALLPAVVTSRIQENPPTAEEMQSARQARDTCLASVRDRRDRVETRRSLILMVLLGSGLVLLMGLAVYGIKSTHRVAGPLFKMGLYLTKLNNNVYDQVYNLRKGDQLVEFYEHFKRAHAGVSTMQQEDRERLRDALKLAKKEGLVDKSPRLQTAVEELERLLAEKEESLDQYKS